MGSDKLVQDLIITSRHFGSPGPLPALEKKIVTIISYHFVGIEINIIQAGFLSIYSLLCLCSVFPPDFKRSESKPLSQLLGSFGDHASVSTAPTGSISPESSVKKSGLDLGGTGGSVRCTLQCSWIKGIVIHRRGRREEKNPQKMVRGMGDWEEQGDGWGEGCGGRRSLGHPPYCWKGPRELDDSENGQKDRDVKEST